MWFICIIAIRLHWRIKEEHQGGIPPGSKLFSSLKVPPAGPINKLRQKNCFLGLASPMGNPGSTTGFFVSSSYTTRTNIIVHQRNLLKYKKTDSPGSATIRPLWKTCWNQEKFGLYVPVAVGRKVSCSNLAEIYTWGTATGCHAGHQEVTGRARLIRSHSSARFCFELNSNSN